MSANAGSQPIDLSGVGGNTLPHKGAMTPSSVEKYEPAKDQEKVRGNIAYILLAILYLLMIGNILFSILLSVSCNNQSDCSIVFGKIKAVSEQMQFMFTSIVGLVGTVVGFYFGSKAGSN